MAGQVFSVNTWAWRVIPPADYFYPGPILRLNIAMFDESDLINSLFYKQDQLKLVYDLILDGMLYPTLPVSVIRLVPYTLNVPSFCRKIILLKPLLLIFHPSSRSVMQLILDVVRQLKKIAR